MDWSAYYRDLVKGGPRWLDYSNARIQVQTFGLMIEIAGELDGRRCLDIGCGRGQLAEAFFDLGAGAVTGVDVVAETIEELLSRRPEINWLCGQFDEPALDEAGPFDVVSAVEVLQYLPENALASLWARLTPGGRLIGIVPNAECPIVARTSARLCGYRAFRYPELTQRMQMFDAVDTWAIRPIAFVEDQRVAPYAAGPWTQVPSWASTPNRLQFVAVKQAA